jgi:hypothetical protein
MSFSGRFSGRAAGASQRVPFPSFNAGCRISSGGDFVEKENCP